MGPCSLCMEIFYCFSCHSAAQLVGLNVLQLMTDGAAGKYFENFLLVFILFISVALNYGLYRQASFNTTPFYIMFYDMGATSTIATIAGSTVSLSLFYFICHSLLHY